MIKTVLAIDSSLACPAFAVVEFNLAAKTAKVLKVTHVKTNSKKPTGYRLLQIYLHAHTILMIHSFDEVVFEKGFNKFPLATQQIQRTVGALLMLLHQNGYDNPEEIAPTSVKKFVTGNGKASKDDVANALFEYVGDIPYKTDDESDAVGVAIALAKKKNWL